MRHVLSFLRQCGSCYPSSPALLATDSVAVVGWRKSSAGPPTWKKKAKRSARPQLGQRHTPCGDSGTSGLRKARRGRPPARRARRQRPGGEEHRRNSGGDKAESQEPGGTRARRRLEGSGSKGCPGVCAVRLAAAAATRARLLHSGAAPAHGATQRSRRECSAPVLLSWSQ